MATANRYQALPIRCSLSGGLLCVIDLRSDKNLQVAERCEVTFLPAADVLDRTAPLNFWRCFCFRPQAHDEEMVMKRGNLIFSHTSIVKIPRPKNVQKKAWRGPKTDAV